MNTLVSITVCDASRDLAEESQEAAFQTMKDLIPIFNRFDPESRISRLNVSGKLNDVPPHFLQVLETSQDLFYQSGKVFDITVLPLLERQQESVAKTGRPPQIQEIQDMRKSLGFEKIKFGPGKIVFAHAGVRITLDGIAKGYIVDQAARTLEKHGVKSALINAGGDIRAIGGKGPVPWQVGLRDPLDRRQHVQIFNLAHMAVATSGNYENYFDPLARHHHIINKDLGDSPRRTISATAVARTAMMADGLSTAMFLAGPKKGLKLIESLPGAEALVMTRGSRIFKSSGWNQFAARG
ncbi:MAG: FAD:protein FMN transferase [Desulfohalobiaceae bacterium]|nr:FAD:protein FMN transferase [Desulfohalobiaceae bacterium]